MSGNGLHLSSPAGALAAQPRRGKRVFSRVLPEFCQLFIRVGKCLAPGSLPPAALTQLGAGCASPLGACVWACFHGGQGCFWFPVFCLNRSGWDGSCFHLSRNQAHAGLSAGAPSCRSGEVHRVEAQAGRFSGRVPLSLLLPFTARFPTFPGSPAFAFWLRITVFGGCLPTVPWCPEAESSNLWVSVTWATSGSLPPPHCVSEPFETCTEAGWQRPGSWHCFRFLLTGNLALEAASGRMERVLWFPSLHPAPLGGPGSCRRTEGASEVGCPGCCWSAVSLLMGWR